MDPQAKKIRQHILKIAHHSGHGHIPTCFSIIELLIAVYRTIRHDPHHPEWPERDILILSKGHAALGLYCTLAELGYFTIDAVYDFGAFGSQFGCHADRHKVPGVEMSTGSLGHGIGVAAGIALGLKLKNSSRKVYVVVGDGEANEGSVWEAIMVATHYSLDNLTILYDNNGSQIRCQPIPNPVARMQAFGCDTVEVDGHDVTAIQVALTKPTIGVRALVANTIKGYGCKTLCQEMFAWHRRSPNLNELQLLQKELDEKLF